MAKQIENRVKEVIGAVLNVDINEIGDDASPENLDKWDSLAHMSIIVSLEETFNIRFTDDQVVKMLDYKLMVLTVREALSAV